MNEDKSSDCFSQKDLLYSEILNTSVKGHVYDLFEKKQKSCTYSIQRSSVLDRASKFLKSVDKVDENVLNVEDVEEGAPVIDMDVTLIQRADDSEYESEFDKDDKSSDDETEDQESVTSSDSDRDDKSQDCSLYDKSMHKMFVADCDRSQNKSRNTLKNDCMLNNFKSLESKEQKGQLLNKKLFSSTDSDCKQSDSFVNNENLLISSDLSNEQFKTGNKEVMKIRKISMSSVQSNTLSKEENEMPHRNFLELSKSDFGLLNDNVSNSSCKHEQNIQNSEDLRFRKRKLIAVIEDNDSLNLCLTKTQKTA